MAQHKHAEYIKAWADGVTIERRISGGNWEEFDERMHVWAATGRWEYRIKPEPKPDVVLMFYTKTNWMIGVDSRNANLKITYDGETLEPKSVEIINKEK